LLIFILFILSFRLSCFLGLFSDVFFYLEMGDPFFEPFGGRFSLKMVVEKFPSHYTACLQNSYPLFPSKQQAYLIKNVDLFFSSTMSETYPGIAADNNKTF